MFCHCRDASNVKLIVRRLMRGLHGANFGVRKSVSNDSIKELCTKFLAKMAENYAQGVEGNGLRRCRRLGPQKD